MKTFDPNYKLLDEMYQDDYYPAFLVDKVKDETPEGHRLAGERRNRHRSDTGTRWMKRSAASMIFRTNFSKTTVRLKRWPGTASASL